ncbi:MAG: integration host factor subunit alpha [Desulfobacterales bacterium]|nr:integration host factor subunit alpha [Desulfobacterales bacterium]
MTLTKADIINIIHKNVGHSKAHSAKVLESLLEIIKQTLASSEDVLISGFGKFCVKNKEERKGRNPQTGEDMMLGSRRVVTFKCSGVLRDRINGMTAKQTAMKGDISASE